MRTPFRTLFLLAVLPVLLTAACGGGSGGSSGGTAALAGRVLTRDGTTSDLGGLRFRLDNTGEVVTTRPDGSFDFGSVPTGTVTVSLVDPALVLAGTTEDEEEGEDGEEGEDEAGDEEDDDGDVDDDDGDDGDDGDDDDAGDDDFDVEDLEDGEQVRVRVRVEGGVIVSVEISRSEEAVLCVDVELERSVESDDPDVEGHLRVTSRDDRQVLRAEAEDLDPGREVELFVIDPDGNEESQGVRAAGDDDEGGDDDGDDGDDLDEEDGEAEWKLDTSRGDALPFGVASVEELQGHRVEIRDATDGTLLLFGEIPELPDPLVELGGDDDEDEQEAAAALVAEAGVVGQAFVEVEREDEDGDVEDELEVEAEDLALAPGTLLEVFLEDGGGALVSIGTATVDSEGDAEIEFETDDGGSLPLGAASVDELAGRRVEIRLESDATLLFSGEVPALVNP